MENRKIKVNHQKKEKKNKQTKKKKQHTNSNQTIYSDCKPNLTDVCVEDAHGSAFRYDMPAEWSNVSSRSSTSRLLLSTWLEAMSAGGTVGDVSCEFGNSWHLISLSHLTIGNKSKWTKSIHRYNWQQQTLTPFAGDFAALSAPELFPGVGELCSKKRTLFFPWLVWVGKSMPALLLIMPGRCCGKGGDSSCLFGKGWHIIWPSHTTLEKEKVKKKTPKNLQAHISSSAVWN